MKKIMKNIDKGTKKIDKNVSKAVGMENGALISGTWSNSEEKRKESENQLKVIVGKKDAPEENVQTTTVTVPQPLPTETIDQTPTIQNEQVKEQPETISIEGGTSLDLTTEETPQSKPKKITMKEQVVKCKEYAKEHLDLETYPTFGEFIDQIGVNHIDQLDRNIVLQVIERFCKKDGIGLQIIKTETNDNPFFFPPNEDIEMNVSGEISGN